MKLTCVHTSPELRILNNLLWKWTKIVDRYCKISKYDEVIDNPWWYNERASLSTLAGAAWSLTGWYALEEYSTQKHSRAQSKVSGRGNMATGRCDLLVATKDYGFAIEAKQVWHPMGSNKDSIAKRLIPAWNDAGVLDIEEADYRLAATFIVPSFAKRFANDKDHIEKINSWINKQSSFRTPKGSRRAVAYVFSKDRFISDQNGRVYPGVILVLEERQRARRNVTGHSSHTK